MTREMADRDAVLVHCSAAADLHACGVAQALRAVLAREDGAEARLRDELVVLVSGYESVAHDGSTYGARQAEARAALSAWDDVLWPAAGQR